MENKKRLIYADDIVKVAEHAFNEWNLAMAASDGDREINHVFKMQELCKAVKAVAENAPTVDAVEVVHGRWIPTYHTYYNRDGACQIADEFHCSVCEIYSRDKWNYCPNCGAKMDGDENG